jgi:hypothetical protein
VQDHVDAGGLLDHPRDHPAGQPRVDLDDARAAGGAAQLDVCRTPAQAERAQRADGGSLDRRLLGGGQRGREVVSAWR